MPFNPSPEVAAARAAAEKLDAPICVVLYLTRDGKFGYASYGETRVLCSQAADLAGHLRAACGTWGE